MADLLVGYKGKLSLLECKTDTHKRYRGVLTEAEAKWHDEWNGYPVFVVLSALDAYDAVGVEYEI